jgi:K+-transporting ATPase ATPase C chain
MKNLRAALCLSLILTFIFGGVYPLIVMGFAQILFPHQAEGSLVTHNGKTVASSLLGQEFSDPKYFWGRISATTPPYNAAASSASNLSPANPKLLEAVKARIAALQKVDPDNKARIPVDLVTSSGSGLDPHISVVAANYQAHRIAQARGMKEDAVKSLINAHTERPGFGWLGEPYVNVVQLNLALDEPETQKNK